MVSPTLIVLIIVSIVVLVIALIPLVGPFIAWRIVSSRQNCPIGPAPASLKAENVRFTNAEGHGLRGWLSRGVPGRGVVVLMHGHMASRLFMLGRARFLVREGFGVLLFDFRAHGASGGSRTSFGYVEREDADAAIAYAEKRFPGEKIGAIAVSMGGAALLLGKARERLSATVLEIVYPRLESAIARRIRAFTGFLEPLFSRRVFANYRHSFQADPRDIFPVEGVKQHMPRLIIAGAEDPFTPLAESRELYDAAQGPKEFWPVARAGHSNIYRRVRKEYELKVLKLFEVLSVDTPSAKPAILASEK